MDAEDEDSFGANQPLESDEDIDEDIEDHIDDPEYNNALIDLLDENVQVLHSEEPEDPDDNNLGLIEALDQFGYGVLSCLTKAEAVSLALFIAKVQSKAPRHHLLWG